jgi:Arc/MetJ-type ribon-helix-helix transcriptional regulator
MTVQLTPEQEHRVVEALRSGAYSSTDEVIDRALEVLHAQDDWLAAHRQEIDAKIRMSIEELENGKGISEDELDAYLDPLKAQPE